MKTTPIMATSSTADTDRKRKALKQAKQLATKRAKTTAKQPKTIEPFRFFDLPAELRNLVYQTIALEQKANLSARKLTDRSGLLTKNAIPQLRDEYLPTLLLYASKVEAVVTDFDFRSIVTFLNLLSNAEVDLLPSTRKSGTKKIEIRLHITHNCLSHANQLLLNRWLNRAGHPTKKGTMLDISYIPFGMYSKTSGTQPHPLIAGCIKVLDGYIQTTFNERAEEEAKKLKDALKM
jgi:hypothetical protein